MRRYRLPTRTLLCHRAVRVSTSCRSAGLSRMTAWMLAGVCSPLASVSPFFLLAVDAVFVDRLLQLGPHGRAAASPACGGVRRRAAASPAAARTEQHF